MGWKREVGLEVFLIQWVALRVCKIQIGPVIFNMIFVRGMATIIWTIVEPLMCIIFQSLTYS